MLKKTRSDSYVLYKYSIYRSLSLFILLCNDLYFTDKISQTPISTRESNGLN